MTTESKQDTRPGVTVLLGAALGALVVVVLLSLLGLFVDGPSAARGAAVGGGIALAVFGLGTAVVHAIAGLMPAASLMVALLTYTLQVVLMAVLVIGLDRSETLGETLARSWFAAAILATTCAWLTTQIWQATHLRLPAYDLADERPEAGAR